MLSKGRILIVDDDAHTVETLSHLLHDEGFDTASAADGRNAIELAQLLEPDVVLLELWLPEQDGMETLRRLRAEAPQTTVVMMSGYGALKIAVKAIQLGAADYLEKPFANGEVLRSVQRAILQRQLHPEAAPRLPQARRNGVGCGAKKMASPRLVCATRGLAEAPRQRTLRRSVVLRGRGLQSGGKTGLLLSPSPPHQGIVFCDMMTREQIPADARWVDSTQFCTSLAKGTAQANTIEHLMSALHAYQITNVCVTLGDEVPFMDGSALAFCQHIEAAGVIEQEALAECFVVDQCYHSCSGDEAKSIMIEPYNGLRITYRASYPAPIGAQEWTYEHLSGAHYRRELAPARTFGFVKDVEAMHDAGLIPGGRLNNTILLGDAGMVNTAPLRFANEFVRHKILDIMGDLYLLGRPIRGHVRANMTGHTDNIALVRQLQRARAAA